MDGLHLAGAEARQHHALRSRTGGQRDALDLLDELRRVRVGVGRHIHAAGQSVALVVEHHLLDLEVRAGQSQTGQQGSAATRRGHTEDAGRGIQLHRHLNLLGQQVRGQRVLLRHSRGSVVGQRQHHVGVLGHTGQVVRAGVVATQRHDIVAAGAAGLLAQSVLEDLVARQEILARAAVAEAHLLDQRVAPTTRQLQARQLGGRASQARQHELAHHILDAVLGRDGEHTGTPRQVRELLNILGVLGRGERLLAARLPVVVVQVHLFARPTHVLNTYSGHLSILRASIKIGAAGNLKVDRMEEWKAIAGYEGLYEVSNLGDIRSLDRSWEQPGPRGGTINRLCRGRLIKAELDRHGYHRVRLWIRGASKKYLVHRLVAAAFLGNPEGKPTVDHINCCRVDNKIDNLRWATHLEQRHNRKCEDEI